MDNINEAILEEYLKNMTKEHRNIIIFIRNLFINDISCLFGKSLGDKNKAEAIWKIINRSYLKHQK